MHLRSIQLLGSWGLGIAMCLSLGAEEKESERSELERTLSGIEKIELMKRGLSADKSLQPGGTKDFVPTVSAESEALPGTSTLPATDRDAAAEKAWKSENWLIEGMQSLEKDGSDDESESQSNPLTNEPNEGSAEFWLQLAMKQSEREADAEESKQQSKAESPDNLAVTNPLNDFMTDWLSDAELTRLDIVKPASESVLSSGDVTWNPAISNTGSGNTVRLEDRFSKSLEVSAETSLPNPYLDGAQGAPMSTLGGMTASTGVFREGPRPSAAVIAPRVVPAPASSSGSAPTAKQPWKPPAKEDEKYFRRLNRF